jgi:hypothetical protein
MADVLSTIGVQDFMKSNDFISVVKIVRVSVENKYPYITFMNSKNIATNIYFSRNAGKLVSEGDTIAKGFFNPFAIAETINKDGVSIMKLVAQGESMRITAEDLF